MREKERESLIKITRYKVAIVAIRLRIGELCTHNAMQLEFMLHLRSASACVHRCMRVCMRVNLPRYRALYAHIILYQRARHSWNRRDDSQVPGYFLFSSSHAILFMKRVTPRSHLWFHRCYHFATQFDVIIQCTLYGKSAGCATDFLLYKD